MLTEKDIQKVIESEFIDKKYHKIALRNIFFHIDNESDLITIDRNNEVFEFEIKCSRWDYKADFEKTQKHNRMIKLIEIDQIPNKFFYVCPEGLIKIDDIQEYAGLLYVVKSGMNKYLRMIKSAPQLHKEKVSAGKWEQIAIKLYHRNK